MYKELSIIIAVIVLVVGLDILTNNYTKASVDIVSEELNILKEDVINEDEQKLKLQMQNIKEKWKERYDVLACYIEHDELEKVQTELTELAANIDVEEYTHCISNIDTAIFILEHIEEKETIRLRSIF